MAKTTGDDLADVIAGGLNKLFKDGKIAFVGMEDTPTDIKDFVSTGNALLDLAICNKPYGGMAFGRIMEISGLEQAGKSLLAAHMMANVQKNNGVAVLIDTETAVNWEFFEAVGIDRKKNFVYLHVNTIEDIFDSIESIIESTRKVSKDKEVIIVVDSIAGASTKRELDQNYDRTGYATDKAILLGAAMRKITSTIAEQKIALVLTNQLRQKMNAQPFADQWTTSGGKSIAFHASVRLRMSLIGKITLKDNDSKEVIGVKVRAKIEKNRLGPPLRSVDFDIYFDRGIDDYGSWLKFLREKEVVDGRANALKYITAAGKELKFNEKDWASMLNEDPELKEEVYLKLCDTLIMSYRTDGITPEDVVVEKITDA